MAPFLNPELTEMMEKFLARKCETSSSYEGSQKTIIEELKAWVIHRKEDYKEQMALGDECQKSSPNDPNSLVAALERESYIEALNIDTNYDSLRAAYLLHALKVKGVTWPELWWSPETDGGVCSFLGKKDKAFNAQETLTILQDCEEKRQQATAAVTDFLKEVKSAAHNLNRNPSDAEIKAILTTGRSDSTDGEPSDLPVINSDSDRWPDEAYLGGWSSGGSPAVGELESGEREMSRQEKGAKARKGTKGRGK